MATQAEGTSGPQQHGSNGTQYMNLPPKLHPTSNGIETLQSDYIQENVCYKQNTFAMIRGASAKTLLCLKKLRVLRNLES